MVIPEQSHRVQIHSPQSITLLSLPELLPEAQSNITIGGNFTLAGTAFTSTSAVLEIDGNAALPFATFIHNNGTVRFNATGGTTTISGTSPAFYILEFVGEGFNYNINSAGNITVANSLNLTGTLFYNLNNGTIEVSGDINVTNSAAGCGGTGLVNIMGAVYKILTERPLPEKELATADYQ